MSVFRVNSFVLLCLVVAGCNKGPALPPTVPVTGTVTLDDKPLDGATVTFFPTDAQKGKSATGTTDSQGKFELDTFVAGGTKAKGAMVGDYQVTVAKTEGGTQIKVPEFTGGDSKTPPKGPPMMMSTVGGKGNEVEPPKSVIPTQYGDPQKSGFNASVKSSGNEPFSFALKSN